MSVLIKGMEMPRDKTVAVVIHPDGTAYTAKMLAGVCTEYLVDCTAVPVPPHGRLIDADYLKRTFCLECTLYPDKCLEKTADGCDWHSIAHLKMCPTVIEAEGE